jgi:hypothetical protein
MCDPSEKKKCRDGTGAREVATLAGQRSINQ